MDLCAYNPSFATTHCRTNTLNYAHKRYHLRYSPKYTSGMASLYKYIYIYIIYTYLYIYIYIYIYIYYVLTVNHVIKLVAINRIYENVVRVVYKWKTIHLPSQMTYYELFFQCYLFALLIC